MEYDHEDVCRRLVAVGEVARDHVLRELRRQSSESLSAIAFETAADKIYVIDRSVETALLPALVEHLQPALSFALICEGVNDEQPLIFPAGTPIDRAAARLIVDPIDGTRPIMYNKRSAWWLAGLAPNRGDETSLRDIDVAVQVEIPTTRAAVADTLLAIRGRGARGETTNLITGERTSFGLGLRARPRSRKASLRSFILSPAARRFSPPSKKALRAKSSADSKRARLPCSTTSTSRPAASFTN